MKDMKQTTTTTAHDFITGLGKLFYDCKQFKVLITFYGRPILHASWP